jgi:hypothetical protein
VLWFGNLGYEPPHCEGLVTAKRSPEGTNGAGGGAHTEGTEGTEDTEVFGRYSGLVIWVQAAHCERLVTA